MGRNSILGLVLVIVLVILVLTGGYLLLNNQGSISFIQPTTTPSLTLTPSLPSPTTTSESDFFSCSVDTDCISVRADNCGCTAGGKATAINTKFKDKWEEEHPREICPAVISEDWSCVSSIPQCVAGKCQLVKTDTK